MLAATQDVLAIKSTTSSKSGSIGTEEASAEDSGSQFSEEQPSLFLVHRSGPVPDTGTWTNCEGFERYDEDFSRLYMDIALPEGLPFAVTILKAAIRCHYNTNEAIKYLDELPEEIDYDLVHSRGEWQKKDSESSEVWARRIFSLLGFTQQQAIKLAAGFQGDVHDLILKAVQAAEEFADALLDSAKDSIQPIPPTSNDTELEDEEASEDPTEVAQNESDLNDWASCSSFPVEDALGVSKWLHDTIVNLPLYVTILKAAEKCRDITWLKHNLDQLWSRLIRENQQWEKDFFESPQGWGRRNLRDLGFTKKQAEEIAREFHEKTPDQLVERAIAAANVIADAAIKIANS